MTSAANPYIDENEGQMTQLLFTPWLLTQRLSWNQIREWYHGQWVELVDYEWEWDQKTPTRARVRNYSSDRRELLERSKRSDSPEGAVILFVGSPNSFINSSYFQQPQDALA
ncbi:MAG: hypothetical protein J5J00_07425 [Deltaproteobacteria bacterium]|nr:hypothetical protein [Deltaproteobacteria bacterium]